MSDYDLLVPTGAHMHTATHRTMCSLLVHLKLARHTHRKRILLGL